MDSVQIRLIVKVSDIGNEDVRVTARLSDRFGVGMVVAPAAFLLEQLSGRFDVESVRTSNQAIPRYPGFLDKIGVLVDGGREYP